MKTENTLREVKLEKFKKKKRLRTNRTERKLSMIT